MHTGWIKTFLLTALAGTLVWFIGCGDKKETVSAVACQGVACWDPPEQTCAADQDDCLSVYNAVGWCAEGACSYAAREEECLGGTCVDGLCEETPCLGTTCATAPDYRCLDETSLLIYNPIGYCASSGGIPECRYADKSVTCENGCENGACKGDPCLHRICFKPPARHCDGDNVIVWDSIGGCEAGECVYGFQTVACASGCENGHCIGTDPCSVMTCNVQPASFCVDGVTLRTYASDGSCDEGACYYAHTDIACASGCENGQCKEQECAGVICDIPIASYCREGGTLNHWDGSDGACEEGVCSYESTSSVCAPVCSDAKCENDPCTGVFCTIPPANYCTDDATLVEYEDMGACSDGHCGYDSGNTACADLCEEGECATGGDADTDVDTDADVDTDTDWSVLPTNQTLCYSNDAEIPCVACDAAGYPDYCGQDAWYPNNARTYICRSSADTEKPCTGSAQDGDVVEDSLTSLIWQRVLPADYSPACENITTCTWDEAQSYCDELDYGGSTEWRLPNYYELSSIVDYGAGNPAIEPEAFPNTLPEAHWTRSSFSDLDAWEVMFLGGNVSVQNKSIGRRARCVRGAIYSPFQGVRYSTFGDVGQEVVLDQATGLEWAKENGIDINWMAALRHCEELDYGGNTDWRLPSIKELQSLVEIEMTSPAWSFPDTPLESYYWSSTTYGAGAGGTMALEIYFAYGSLLFDDKTSTSPRAARCVRGGP